VTTGVEDWAWDAYHGRIARGVSEEDAARNAAIECGCAEEQAVSDDDA
jgi:hypothetical protein